MMRILDAISYLAFVLAHIVSGTFQVMREAVRPSGHPPSIVEFPLRCHSDLEVTLYTMSVTMTPGTLVLGAAPASDDHPPVVYVHDLFDADRDRAIAGLRELETRLLRATRGREAVG